MFNSFCEIKWLKTSTDENTLYDLCHPQPLPLQVHGLEPLLLHPGVQPVKLSRGHPLVGVAAGLGEERDLGAQTTDVLVNLENERIDTIT